MPVESETADDLAPNLPVAVIGAGPVGLAAAAHLIARGLPVKVYEAGATVAANVRDWGHVRLFSPWEYNIDPAARALLERRGWQEPPAMAFPTGATSRRLPQAAGRDAGDGRRRRDRRASDSDHPARRRQGREQGLADTKPFALSVSNGNGAVGAISRAP